MSSRRYDLDATRTQQGFNSLNSGLERVSGESTRKSLSLGETEFYVLNLVCAAECSVMHSWSGKELVYITLTGRPDIESALSTGCGA